MDDVQTPYSLLIKQIELQYLHFGRKWVLFTDIDRTAYRRGIDNSQLGQQIEIGKWGLVYVTGRHLEGVIELLQKGKLKKPHAVATNVGTRLYFLKVDSEDKKEAELTCNDFIEDVEFVKKAIDTGFKKRLIHGKGRDLITIMHELYPQFELQFQEHEKDDRWKTVGSVVDPFKVSFTYKIPQGTPKETKKNFIREIKEFFAGCCTVISLDIECQEKNTWCLDIVPFAKDKAVRYLNRKFKVRGIVAGDSGNDLHMLFGKIGEATRDFLRICVGGTTHDVLEEISKLNIRQEIASWAYRKHTDSDDFMYAYIEPSKECLGPISLAQAMKEAEFAHTSSYISPEN